MASTVRIQVFLSEDQKTATVHMSGRSDPIVAGCLGVDLDGNGDIHCVYLNALVHRQHAKVIYEEWEPSGAISTILTRKLAEVV